MQIREFHTVFEDLLHVFSNKTLLHYTDLDWCDSINSQSLIQWVEASDRISWAAYENETFLGFVSAHLVRKHKTASITIVVLEPFQHQGIAKKLLQFAVNQLFENDFVRIEAQICTENKFSLQLFEAVGFTCEGRLRKNFLIDGFLYDSFMYAKFAGTIENKS